MSVPTPAQTVASDRDWVAQILAGDEAVLTEVIRTCSPAMKAAIYALTPHAVDDVLQEAWIAAIGAIADFRFASTLKSWLVRIAMNKAYDRLRKDKKTVSFDALYDDHDVYLESLFDGQNHWNHILPRWQSPNPSDMLEAVDLKRCIDKHIRKLPDNQQQALLLTDIEELDSQTICNTLAVSTSNYRVLLHRARLAIHHMIYRYQETGEC